MFSQQWFLDLLREVVIVILVAILGALGYHTAVIKPALKRLEQRVKELHSFQIEWSGCKVTTPDPIAPVGDRKL